VKKLEIKSEKLLSNLLDEALSGLFYVSETDAPFVIFFGEKVKQLNIEIFRSSLEISEQEFIEERKFDEFFAKLTTEKDWFGEIEKKKSRRYVKLKQILEENIKEIKVFRVGKISIEIYIIGLDKENNIFGVRTNAVET
jgi:Nuclease A inhibitor-like protein